MILTALEISLAQGQILDLVSSMMPEAISSIKMKGGPSAEEIKKSEVFFAKILGIPANQLLAYNTSNPEVQVLSTFVYAVVVLSFRENGITLWSRSWKS